MLAAFPVYFLFSQYLRTLSMRLFFSVGEPSGDQHAARLLRELKSRAPDLEVSGFGGPLMEKAGLRCHYRLTDLAVMGFLRVVPLLWRFYGLLRLAERKLREERPDAVVLVDFPGFNWWIAHKAKKLGIRVFYYLPPQLWAWAPWRIKRVQRNVDHVLCGLSFEQAWYAERGVSAEYVGHPFFDEIQEHDLDREFLLTYRAQGGRVLGILPGSRNHEVEQNWPVMIKVIERLVRQHADTRFLVACFSESHRRLCVQKLHEANPCTALPIGFHVGKTSEIIELAECCLMVSGSVSLEMLARTTPAVVIYYLGWTSRLLLKLLVRCRFASLPNLMVDRELLPEFFPQGDGAAAAEQAASRLSLWLADAAALNGVAAELRRLKSEVVKTGSIARVADAILTQTERPAGTRAA